MAWIIAAAIIAAAIIVSVALNEDSMRYAVGPDASRSAGEGAVSGGAVSGGSVSGAMTGIEARKKYADRTIQFDETCQARPNAPVYKSGQYVLLDNRDEAARVISVGGHQYTIGGYGYAIVAMPTTSVQKTYTVDCDFNQNVSTVTVQK